MPGDTGTDWRAIANVAFQAKLTVVIYMGVISASHIQKELLYGLPASIPAYLRFHLHLGWQTFHQTSGKVADYLRKSIKLIQSNDLSGLFQTSPQPWAEAV